MPTNATKLILLLVCLTSMLEAKTDQTVLEDICMTDSQCSPPYITCQQNECQHKPLFGMESKEIIGMIVLITLSMFAAAGGIGGGPLLVPVLLIFYDFSTKEAIAFSNGLIFFSGAVKFGVGITRKHPNISYKTLIDYNVITVFIATILLGSFLGSTISAVLPDLIQLIGLVLVVIFAIYKSLKKSLKLYKQETIQLNKRKVRQDETKVKGKKKAIKKEIIPSNTQSENKQTENKKMKKANELPPLELKSPVKDQKEDSNTETVIIIESQRKLVPTEPQTAITEAISPEDIKAHQIIRKIEGSNFYYKKILVVIGVLSCSLLVIFLRGGKGLDSVIGVNKCESMDWVVMAIYAILIAGFVYLGNRIVLSEQRFKKKHHWVPAEDEKIFDKKFIMKSNISGILVGFIASIVGIGGGIITNPVLISQDFIPQVVSFTGMYLTVVNKLVSSTVFILSGRMPMYYLLFTGIVLAIGVTFVEFKIAKIVKKLGRQSIISFLFAAILVVALILTLYVGIQNTKEDYDKGIKLFGFTSYCKA